MFLGQALENLYRDIRRQSALLTILSAIALCIAALGLFTLSAFATRQRLLEISVRKALALLTVSAHTLAATRTRPPGRWTARAMSGNKHN